MICFTALQKSKKEREIQKIEIRKLKDELHDSKEQITAYNLEERKLLKIIQDGDHEREKQKKEMERVNRNHLFFLYSSITKLTYFLNLLSPYLTI